MQDLVQASGLLTLLTFSSIHLWYSGAAARSPLAHWYSGTLGLGFKISGVQVKFLLALFYRASLGVFANSLAVGLLFVRLKKDLKIFFSCSTMIFLYKE
jgi:hypothetical protein